MNTTIIFIFIFSLTRTLLTLFPVIGILEWRAERYHFRLKGGQFAWLRELTFGGVKGKGARQNAISLDSIYSLH